MSDFDGDAEEVSRTFFSDSEPCFILHRDLDSDVSDDASDNDNPLDNSDSQSILPRKQVKTLTAAKRGVHCSATRQRAVLRGERGRGRRGRRGRGGNNKQPQTATTMLVWQILPTQTNGYVFVNPNNHILFHEPNGFSRIAYSLLLRWIISCCFFQCQLSHRLQRKPCCIITKKRLVGIFLSYCH